MFHNRRLDDSAGAKSLVREHLNDVDAGWSEMTSDTMPPVTMWMHGEMRDAILLMMDETGLIGDYHPIGWPLTFDGWGVSASRFGGCLPAVCWRCSATPSSRSFRKKARLGWLTLTIRRPTREN